MSTTSTPCQVVRQGYWVKKKVFPDAVQAETVIHMLKVSREERRRIRYYYCRPCGGYHIGHWS